MRGRIDGGEHPCADPPANMDPNGLSTELKRASLSRDHLLATVAQHLHLSGTDVLVDDVLVNGLQDLVADDITTMFT